MTVRGFKGSLFSSVMHIYLHPYLWQGFIYINLTQMDAT